MAERSQKVMDAETEGGRGGGVGMVPQQQSSPSIATKEGPRLPPVIDENAVVSPNTNVTMERGILSGQEPVHPVRSRTLSESLEQPSGGTPHTDRSGAVTKTPGRPRVSINVSSSVKLTSRTSIGNTPSKGLPRFSLSKLLSPSPAVPSVNLSGITSGGSTYRATGSFKSTRRSLYHDRDLFDIFKRKQKMAGSSLTNHRCPFRYIENMDDLSSSVVVCKGNKIEGGAPGSSKAEEDNANSGKKGANNASFIEWRKKMAEKVKRRKERTNEVAS